MMKYKHTVFFLGTFVLFLGMISFTYCTLSPRIHNYHHQSQQVLSLMADIQKTSMSKIVSGHPVSQDENKSTSLASVPHDPKHMIYTTAKKNYVSVLSVDETVNESKENNKDNNSIVTYTCSWEADLDVDIVKAMQDLNEKSKGILVVNHFEVRKVPHNGSHKAIAKVTLSHFRHHANAKESDYDQ